MNTPDERLLDELEKYSTERSGRRGDYIVESRAYLGELVKIHLPELQTLERSFAALRYGYTEDGQPHSLKEIAEAMSEDLQDVRSIRRGVMEMLLGIRTD